MRWSHRSTESISKPSFSTRTTRFKSRALQLLRVFSKSFFVFFPTRLSLLCFRREWRHSAGQAVLVSWCVCLSRLGLASAGRCGASARRAVALARGGQLGARGGGGGALAAGGGFLRFWVCGCVGVCGVGIWRNKAGGAGVAYGTLIRRTGWRVAVRAWRRRGLAGQAAPVSPFTEDRRSTPCYLTFVCSFYPAAFPKPPPRGLPTARQTHAHFHLFLARFFSLHGG